MKHNRGNFAAWFIRQAMDSEEIQIFGDGSQLRDFTYVDDVVDAFLLAGVADSSDGEVFNLGGERPCSLREYVEMLCKLCPGATFKTEPFPEDRQRIDVGSVYNSYDKIKNKFGWSPGICLEEGLNRTIDFFRENRTYYWR
jgi:UDP-glucose 4-epimerase